MSWRWLTNILNIYANKLIRLYFLLYNILWKRKRRRQNMRLYDLPYFALQGPRERRIIQVSLSIYSCGAVFGVDVDSGLGIFSQKVLSKTRKWREGNPSWLYIQILPKSLKQKNLSERIDRANTVFKKSEYFHSHKFVVNAKIRHTLTIIQKSLESKSSAQKTGPHK